MKNRNIIIIILILLGLISLVYFLNKSSQIKETINLKVGYPSVSTSLPLFVAVEEKLFEKRGITVEPIRFETANQIVEALVTNRIDATSVCADYPFLSMATKNDKAFKLFAWSMLDTKIPFDVILSKKGSGIKSLTDLEGKKIATFPGSQLKHYLGLILEKATGKKLNVEIIEMAPANQIPALVSGSVDALFTLEPLATIATVQNIGEPIEASLIGKYIGDGNPIPAASFGISSEFINKNPKTSQAYVDAMNEAIELINANPSKYSYLYPKFTPIKAELASKIPITEFKTYHNMDISLLQKEADILFNAGLLEKQIDVKNLIYKK